MGHVGDGMEPLTKLPPRKYCYVCAYRIRGYDGEEITAFTHHWVVVEPPTSDLVFESDVDMVYETRAYQQGQEQEQAAATRQAGVGVLLNDYVIAWP